VSGCCSTLTTLAYVREGFCRDLRFVLQVVFGIMSFVSRSIDIAGVLLYDRLSEMSPPEDLYRYKVSPQMEKWKFH